MAVLLRVPVVWSGLTGLPGVSVLYWDGGVSSVMTDVTAFFNAIKGVFPSGLSWTIPNAGDNIDDATGTLIGDWSTTGGGTVSATGGFTAYAAGTGARVRWNTGNIVDGRRLRGSTFLVPLTGGGYDSSGTIENTTLSTLQTAATTLASTGALKVWSRPTPGGSDGTSGTVLSAVVPDRVTSLRSRRT